MAPATWPAWQPEIVETDGPERVDEGAVVRGRARMLGFDVQGHSTTRAVRPEVVEEDVIVGVHMVVRYELDEDEGGTTVTHRLELDPPRGVAGRLLALMLRRRLKRMQTTALRRLVLQAEAGAPPQAGAPST